MKKTVHATLPLVLLVLSLFLLHDRDGSGGDGAAPEDRLPAVALVDLQGEAVDLCSVAAENRLLLVNFWASWCQPCRKELPELEHRAPALAERGVAVYTVNVDSREAAMETFLADPGLSLPVLRTAQPSPGPIEAFQIRGMPTTLLVKPDCRVASSVVGLQNTLGLWVEKHLSEG